MKKIFWSRFRLKLSHFGKRGKKVFKKTSEVAEELERMGKLGGQLFVARVS